MKFFLAQMLLFLTTLGGCFSDQQSIDQKNELTLRVLQQNNHVQPPVVSLMQTLGCTDVPTRVDLFAEAFFSRFARKRGVERWDMENNFDEATTTKCLDYFNQLGFISEIKPTKQRYDYLVLLGSTLQGVRSRLGYFKKLWMKGLRVKKIVFLTSDRPLMPFEDAAQLADRSQIVLPIKASWLQPQKHPETEGAMMRELWSQAELPKELEAVPLECVVVPMKVLPDGSLERPNTGDTVERWLAQKPDPGKCLLISSQPYIGYQSGVARRLIPKDFTIEAVGPAADKERKSLAVLIDSLIRWLIFETYICGLWNEQKLELYLKQ